MAWLIWMDTNGAETCREKKGRGRPPNGSIRKEDGNFYTEEIYKQRFLPKWVYLGKDFTMICCDTQVDGNKFLRVFDNAKHQSDI